MTAFEDELEIFRTEEDAAYLSRLCLPNSPVSGRVMGVLQIPRSCNFAGDLPDVLKCFREIAPAGDRRATLHGVVFDILVWSESRSGAGMAAGRCGCAADRSVPVPVPASISGRPANTGAYPGA